jgi:hypothetical protein
LKFERFFVEFVLFPVKVDLTSVERELHDINNNISTSYLDQCCIPTLFKNVDDLMLVKVEYLDKTKIRGFSDINKQDIAFVEQILNLSNSHALDTFIHEQLAQTGANENVRKYTLVSTTNESN